VAQRDGRENVVSIAGKHDADGDLTIVGAVGCVESAAAAVKPDIPANLLTHSFSQTRNIHLHRLGGASEFGELVRHAA
jgi:hypothetical protein